MNESLHRLLDDPRLWRAGRHQPCWPVLASGHPALDALLPGGGWPARLTEIAVAHWGSGELALFMPLLQRLSQDEGAGWFAWIAPPYLPYAPAFAAADIDLARMLLVHARDDREILWATEQALQSGSCRMVLAWVARADGRALRRLQLAAEHRQTPVILFRPPAALAAPSPAALRLSLESGPEGPCLHLRKHRGGAARSLPVTALHGR